MAFEVKKEGNPLFDLVKGLANISQDEFLETYTQPCLLQIPVEGAFPEFEGKPGLVTKPLGSAASTMHISVEDLGSLKRSKNVHEALVHFLPVKDGAIVLGRAPECDLILTATGVSRKHAELRKTLGPWMLVDLASHNGSFVNGKKLDPDTPTPVQDKQNLWFGSYRALFLYPEQVFNLANNLRKKSTA